MNYFYPRNAEEGEFIVNFNENAKSLAVASDKRLTLYNLETIDDTFDTLYQWSGEEIVIFEKLHKSSLAAIVTKQQPRNLRFIHLEVRIELHQHMFRSIIKAVKVNEKRLVACLEQAITILSVPSLEPKHDIEDTPFNSNGLIALSPSSENCYLAHLGSSCTGDVFIFDLRYYVSKIIIHAHEAPLSALEFSQSGTEIATASNNDTVIRVFSTENGNCLFELQRGLMNFISIVSLAFSNCSEYIITTSNSELAQIFRLDRQSLNAEKAEKAKKIEKPEKPKKRDRFQKPQSSNNISLSQLSTSVYSYLRESATTYLPTQVTKVFTQTRPCATITFAEPGVHRICRMTTINGKLRILVASQAGYLYVYGLPEGEAIECTLIKIYEFTNDEDKFEDTYANLTDKDKTTLQKSLFEELTSKKQSEDSFTIVSLNIEDGLSVEPDTLNESLNESLNKSMTDQLELSDDQLVLLKESLLDLNASCNQDQQPPSEVPITSTDHNDECENKSEPSTSKDNKSLYPSLPIFKD